MLSLRRHCGLCLLFCVLAASPLAASANDSAFPFGRTLLLDATPLPGSKRVPMIEIDKDGTASIYLWCTGVRGSANVGADTITITPTAPLPSHCTPDQISLDAALLVQLSQMTGWHRNADEIDLVGATTLRFRLMTN
ncbi:MAG: META domain-containing protein [Xanthobacteraceae bacterium]